MGDQYLDVNTFEGETLFNAALSEFAAGWERQAFAEHGIAVWKWRHVEAGNGEGESFSDWKLEPHDYVRDLRGSMKLACAMIRHYSDLARSETGRDWDPVSHLLWSWSVETNEFLVTTQCAKGEPPAAHGLGPTPELATGAFILQLLTVDMDAFRQELFPSEALAGNDTRN